MWLEILLALMAMLTSAPLGFFTCCCQTGCSICTDSFTRADDTDISTGSSCGWTKQAGTSAIASNALAMTASNTLVLCNASSGTTPAVRAKVEVRMGSTGDKARLVIKYKDSNNYWYAEVTAGSPGSLRIFEVASGTHTQRGSTLTATAPTGSWLPLAICYGEGRVRVTFGDLYNFSFTTTTTATDCPQAGLACGSITSLVEFRNFDFSYGYATSDHDTCPHCLVTCEECGDGLPMPRAFKAEIYGVANHSCAQCTTANGAIVYMDKIGGILGLPGDNTRAKYCATGLGMACSWDMMGVLICTVGAGPQILVALGPGPNCSSNSGVGGIGLQWQFGPPQGQFGPPPINCREYVNLVVDQFPTAYGPSNACLMTGSGVLLTSIV